MQFRIVLGKPYVPGQLVYVANEYSFTFEAKERPDGITSLQINSLQLEINEEGRVLYVWGYCPLLRLQVTESSPPSSPPGQLFVGLNEIIPGVTLRVDDEMWPVSINPNNGWICLGDPYLQTDVTAVEFAQSCVAVLCNGNLAALWLRP